MGVGAAADGRREQLNWTLTFSDARLEEGYRARACRVWQATELWRLKLNLAVGLVNLSITTWLLSFGVFTKQGIGIVAPYMTVAVLHYCMAAWYHGKGRGSWVNLLAEACYSLICTLSMPTWVLHGECVELKVFLRKLILGSGVLIGMWCRFLTPTFFAQALWLTPLQFAFQGWQLTEPTCAALAASPYSKAALQQLLRGLSRLASWVLHETTAAGSHGSSSSSTSDHVSYGDQACYSMLYLLQLFAGGTLLYALYRMERSSRIAFVKGRVVLQSSWPAVPAVAQVVLHVVVYLQLFAVLWTLSQAGSSMGVGAVS